MSDLAGYIYILYVSMLPSLKFPSHLQLLVQTSIFLHINIIDCDIIVQDAVNISLSLILIYSAYAR